MKFKPGAPKPENSGRKKGTKNIRKVARVADILAEKGIDPIEKILELMAEKDDKDKFVLSPSAKVDLWLELQSYCEAKPKLPDNIVNVNQTTETNPITIELLEELGKRARGIKP